MSPAPQTVAEKLFSRKLGRPVWAGETVTAPVDVLLTNDASGPLSIDYFEKMGASRVRHPQRVVAVVDHYVPCPNRQVAALHQSLCDFQRSQGIRLLPAGEGIAHQLLDELGEVAPGRLIIGGDSHTTTHGWLCSLSVGVGASDFALAMASGALWFRVPESVRITLRGAPGRDVSGKDVALALFSRLPGTLANYRALEFTGEGVAALDLNDRKTICNLMAESSAKCAIMPLDERAAAYCAQRGLTGEGAEPDPGCAYAHELTLDISQLTPQIACPPTPGSDVRPLAQLAGLPVDMVVLGTCTNGRYEDFLAVDELLRHSAAPFRAETLAIPASRAVYAHMVREGMAARLLERGAMLLPPGCGPCCGSSPGVPRDGFTVLSTANRNFVGRMGNTSAQIYLSNPVVAAAAALTGRVTDPKELRHA